MSRTLTLCAALLVLTTGQALGHCQIPCGIYDDEMRLDMMAENAATIAKAMKQVGLLSKASPPDYNQIIRWTNVKDEHADDNAHIVSWYFLQQRVKPVEPSDAEAYKEYLHKLTLLHEMLVYSMKVKQSTDPANVDKIQALLADFRKAYLTHEHSGKHQ
jgi:nickel superoxide dismutase